MAAVLVVDDDHDSCEILDRLLKRSGYQVRCAHNGRQALGMLLRAELLPDVLLLDMQMPEMDGLSFLQVIRSYLRLQRLPVIIVTAGTPDWNQLIPLGVKNVFRKASLKFDQLVKDVDDAVFWKGDQPPHTRSDPPPPQRLNAD